MTKQVTTKNQEASPLMKIKGFETLFAKDQGGKFYIYSTYEKSIIRPYQGFDTLATLEAYANEKYYDEYV